MAGKPKKTKTMDKWRKKRYFPVLAPKIFQERELGKSMAYEPDSLIGRTLSVNLMVLTGNIKKQNINLSFRVDKVRGDTAYTFVNMYEVNPAAVKRKVRRQRDRLDDSFQCVTKDNKLVRVKPLIITSVRTSSMVRSGLRKLMVQKVKIAVRKLDYDSFVMELVNDRFQKDIRNSINKVVPVRSVDIRIMKYLGEQEAGEALDAAPEEVDRPQAETEDVPEKAPTTETTEEGSA